MKNKLELNMQSNSKAMTAIVGSSDRQHTTRNVLLLLFVLISITSCKKFIEVPPPVNSITENFVFTTDATSISALNGLYSLLSKNPIQGGQTNGNISMFAGLAADEYSLNPGITAASYVGYYQNALSQAAVANVSGSEHWASLYNFIFRCNAIIEGLNKSNSLTPLVKKQLIGEAMFIRAFCYFYLTNLYGDVPLALTTDYTDNALLSRSPKAQVYEQIINDLKNSKDLLSGEYLDGSLLKRTSERVRPTKWAATALLARVYLYTNNWANAEVEASKVINNVSSYSLNTLDEVFLKNSSEAIWQLQPVAAGWNTEDARLFILPSSGPTTSFNPVYLSSSMLNGFETGDLRAEKWINSTEVGGTTYYYPYKYKINTFDEPVTEYMMVLRLGEQYLIRAESEAASGRVNSAITDLNIIRKRANLSSYDGPTDKTSVLNAIYHERNVELFTEWGHRWFDLKRTGTVDFVMGMGGACAAKGGTWNTNWQFYPIQSLQIQRAPGLVQNPGY